MKPVLICVFLLAIPLSAQNNQENKSAPKLANTSHGCIVVKTESGGEEVVGELFRMGENFYYVYSNNINGVKAIDHYKDELAKGKKPDRGPLFNLTTLVVWSWQGTKIVPLKNKHTDAELKDAIRTCDAFVANADSASK